MNTQGWKAVVYSLVFFLAGGIILPRFDAFIFDLNTMGEPAIFYTKVQLTNEDGELLSNPSFRWSNSISLALKRTSPFVIDEVSQGCYVIAIVGAYQLSSHEITIMKEGYEHYTYRFDAMESKKFRQEEDNFSDDWVKVILRKY